MRTTVLVLTVAAALAAALYQDKPAKPKPDVGAGRIAWFDITTKDMAKSKEFYGKLFDWKFNSPEGMDFFAEIVSGDVGIGTLRVAEGAISHFNGVVYVQVDDIQVACRKAKELGATVIDGFPFDLEDGRGAIGLANDPVGHPIGMYSRTPIAKPSDPAGK